MSELLKFVQDNRVAKHGDFTLSSGKKSNFYFDAKQISLDSEGLRMVSVRLLDSLLEVSDIDAIGAVPVGGVPIVGGMLGVASILDHKPLKGFIVRKEPKDYGTKKFIEGPVLPGMKVSIIEDVATTGKSALFAIEKAQEFGLNVVSIGAILNRQEGAEELFFKMGIPFVYLLKKEQLNA